MTSSELRAESRKQKQSFNAEDPVLSAELEKTGLLNKVTKAYQLAKKAAKAMFEARDQWASVLEYVL